MSNTYKVQYTYKVQLLTCPKLELLIKYNLGRLCSSLELELSLKTSFRQSLFKSHVGTTVNFCSRVSGRDPNCNIQESLRCNFFEKISDLIISLIQISYSFLHLFLTSANSSRELNGVTWSFRSHFGQFLNYKLTRDVPGRPGSTWASVLPV